MQGSKIVAAIVSIGVVGGGALALARGSESSAASAREAVCISGRLTPPEQDSCKTQMKAAKSEVAKQQIATRFQSKVDIRDAVAQGSNASSSAGGVSTAPGGPGGTGSAAGASLSHPNDNPK